MTHLGYILAGWGVALGGLIGYAIRVLARGRRASEFVPEDRRRWMACSD